VAVGARPHRSRRRRRPWPLWLRNAAARPELELLPLTVDVAIESEHLGDAVSADPADRLIAATARIHGLTLITIDKAIQKSGAVRTLW
jgi:PIN domain nuclease of toxin-antitoxin system